MDNHIGDGAIMTLLLISLLCGLLVLGLGSIFLLIVRTPPKKRQGLQLLVGCLALLTCSLGLVFYIVPLHNSKLRILSCLEGKFQISYWDLSIEARSPGEGELVDLRDSQFGAFVFTSERPLPFEGTDDCLSLYQQIQSALGGLQESTRLDPNSLSMKCATYEVGSKFQTCSLLQHGSENRYYLFYQWSFG